MWLLWIALGITWLFLAFVTWTLVQVLQQAGRLIARLETLESRPIVDAPIPIPFAPEEMEGLDEVESLGDGHAVVAAQAPAYSGLPIGADAPPFDLPDLTGKRHALSEWRGKRVLVVFFSPHCGFCTMIAPDLAAAPTDGMDGYPVPIIVTNGSIEDNRDWIGEYGVGCTVLRQEGMTVANQYKATGTPMGYLIDEEGRIASEMAVGGPPIVDLLAPAGTHAKGKATRPLSESHIPRDGLSAGTPAPDFELPLLGGGTVSLAQYSGRRVTLVFTDPQCGPCLELAPKIEQFHRKNPDFDVLMISRGDPAANRAKVKDHRLTMPVALQKRWEVSRKYALFATPIAYLVDEGGIIAEDLAMGPDAILDMVNRAAAAKRREEVKL